MGWLDRLRGAASPGSGPLAQVTARALRGVGSVGGDAMLSQEESAQSAFFVATFALLAKMAKADGVVSLDEIKMVDHFIEERLKCPAATRRFAVQVFTEARDSPHAFDVFAKEFRRLFDQRSHMRVAMLEILYRVAMADGTLHPEEAKLLKSAGKLFGIPPKTARFIHARFAVAGNNEYAILQCKPGVTLEHIRASHEALRREHDPQAAVAAGLPQEFTELARQNLEEIDEAFRRLEDEWGAA